MICRFILWMSSIVCPHCGNAVDTSGPPPWICPNCYKQVG